MVYIKLRCCIRTLRKDRDLTQEELSEALGISRQSLISLESGKSIPSLGLALKFSQLFELPIELIFRSENVINARPSRENQIFWQTARGIHHWQDLVERIWDDRYIDLPKNKNKNRIIKKIKVRMEK